MTYRVERMQWNTAKDLDIEQIMADQEATSDELKSCVESLQDEIERLRDELLISSQLVDACKKDAERYRFFKAEHETHGGSMYAVWDNGADDLDEAIDAAMKGGE